MESLSLSLGSTTNTNPSLCGTSSLPTPKRLAFSKLTTPTLNSSIWKPSLSPPQRHDDISRSKSKSTIPTVYINGDENNNKENINDSDNSNNPKASVQSPVPNLLQQNTKAVSAPSLSLSLTNRSSSSSTEAATATTRKSIATIIAEKFRKQESTVSKKHHRQPMRRSVNRFPFSNEHHHHNPDHMTRASNLHTQKHTVPPLSNLSASATPIANVIIVNERNSGEKTSKSLSPSPPSSASISSSLSSIPRKNAIIQHTECNLRISFLEEQLRSVIKELGDVKKGMKDMESIQEVILDLREENRALRKELDNNDNSDSDINTSAGKSQIKKASQEEDEATAQIQSYQPLRKELDDNNNDDNDKNVNAEKGAS